MPGSTSDGSASVIPRGEIIEKMVCLDQPEQNYALYLPAAYTPEKKWPVVFIFDPWARGSFVLELFQSAAEKMGYVLVASNISRNGPLDPNIDSALAVWRDSNLRLSLDQEAVFTAGFSGGAQVALACAFHFPVRPQAIIMCGRGKPDWLEFSQIPLGISFFIAAGYEDFNSAECRDFNLALEQRLFTRLMVNFPGAHEWFDREWAEKALVWFEIDRLKKGLIQISEERLQRWMSIGAATIKNALDQGNTVRAFWGCRRLIDTFSGLADVSTLRTLQTRLASLDSVRYHFDLIDRADSLQRKTLPALKKAYSAFLAAAPGSIRENRALKELDIPSLRQRSEGAAGLDRLLARRLLGEMYMAVMTDAVEMFQAGNELLALRNAGLASGILPEKHFPHFLLARIYARQNQAEKMISALEKAFELGFNNHRALLEHDDFNSMKKNHDFNKLIKKHFQQERGTSRTGHPDA